MQNKQLKELLNQLFKINNNTNSNIITVEVYYTTYDSGMSECYDGYEILAEYVSINEAKEIIANYLSDKDLSNLDRIEDNEFAYGHDFSVTYYSKEEILLKINELKSHANDLEKLLNKEKL